MPRPIYLVTLLPGLERWVEDEIVDVSDGRVTFFAQERPDELCFATDVAAERFLGLQCAVAIFASLAYDVIRPKALLGDELFAHICQSAETIVRRARDNAPFSTLRLSAAGEQTPVMQRLRRDLAASLGLRAVDDEGDLLVRLRPLAKGGWEVLLRLTPRPLATRAWRVINFPGALNATLAQAMVRMTTPTPLDRFLNICCGSGTLLAERLLFGEAQSALGCDLDWDALGYARENLTAAGVIGQAELETWDATDMPLEPASCDVIVSDIPFGQLMGTHATNLLLYPALIAETARVAAPGARLALLTHELRLMERALWDEPRWKIEAVMRVQSSGMTPAVFVARRTAME